MATYKSPVQDMEFVLNEIINVGSLTEIEKFEDATEDIITGVLDEAAKQIDNTIGVLNESGDAEGASLNNGEVTTPEGFKEAYASYAESGWIGLDKDIEFDGQGLPYVLATAVTDMLSGANAAFSLYPGLSNGAYEALKAHGTQAQKETYMSHLSLGDWSGTMCLTEPGAGSDLGQVRTKAVPQEDGSYLIEGNKIFITAGEHDLTDNIIHLVLARTPGAPEGIRGISMFVVPKFLINEDGSLGERNAAECANIEEKMGIHGSSTCVMNFTDAKGYLVGELNKGIQNMFVMMNAARLMVGLQGLGVAERATQNAITYAKERKQGRPLTRKAESSFDSDTIIVHPDVRRMLFTMKALTEGCRMMAYDTAKHVDLSENHPDEAVRNASKARVDLMTPVCKAFITDVGVEVSGLGVQVYGGHGYIKEHGMEQNMRDSKIFCIYEGTNGIQAMDLVGRKLSMNDGQLPIDFFAEVKSELASASAEMAFVTQPLTSALSALEEVTAWLIKSKEEDLNDSAAAAVDYLQMFGLVSLGYYWLRAAKVASGKEGVFYQGKLATANFFATKLLPRVHGLAPVVMSGSRCVMEPSEELIV
ncbi:MULTISPECIES: acyl-CoA dehydrogenase C-terminal domain-containing protein [Cycloclasticus]|uniref:3-methylmercaptopropionyl-CoA dehydrogenase n=1 Tax=Cycloclasticus pugetii TaxID=34068 RepID=A0AB33Z042_9GAMM|nr:MULTISPECIES: acyl-CoA dehydrogenase C-terminal domain-containing protein [Cycloclasticus]AFT66306.1 Acyl-CoA dehydrogenase domain protein [Cycloclasticus sp. P1]ATI04118.2 acyl-CoA dehydrogenase [Cycloclasticus sp. PY97N]EPD12341.1 acyl-CoA dehydrogenase [Cycloclasticus pugetii]MBV1898369.1 acyl-CoA dehydrogenase C-terminal domain-containing protein [Cycloclasticus sp.]